MRARVFLARGRRQKRVDIPLRTLRMRVTRVLRMAMTRVFTSLPLSARAARN